MGVDIVRMEDCASNYGVYKVPGSKGQTYEVSLHGSEDAPHCTCMAFAFSQGQSCKHVKAVLDGACLYNPQWHDAKENPAFRPAGYTYDKFSGSKCECGGPMVVVLRAV